MDKERGVTGGAVGTELQSWVDWLGPGEGFSEMKSHKDAGYDGGRRGGFTDSCVRGQFRKKRGVLQSQIGEKTIREDETWEGRAGRKINGGSLVKITKS